MGHPSRSFLARPGPFGYGKPLSDKLSENTFSPPNIFCAVNPHSFLSSAPRGLMGVFPIIGPIAERSSSQTGPSLSLYHYKIVFSAVLLGVVLLVHVRPLRIFFLFFGVVLGISSEYFLRTLFARLVSFFNF